MIKDWEIDLNNIRFSTFERYLKEIKEKYPRGKKIRSNAYPDLDGELLRRDYFLKIPASNQFIPNLSKFITAANKCGVTLRSRPE